MNHLKLLELIEKSDKILRQQKVLDEYIQGLRKEIEALRLESEQANPSVSEEKIEAVDLSIPLKVTSESIPVEPVIPTIINEPTIEETSSQNNFSLERFIGENVASKVGILITVLGIAIGVKYAIDHNLISPVTRIILGYLMGFGLFRAAIKLRPKYTDLSAVILSGSLASFYFVTYAAYDLYHLIPQTLAFLMMVIVTIFTVISAWQYDKQIIALGGLVGGYAIPFLLSNDTGRPEILFSYMALLNIGILVVSFKKYWRILYYSAFVLTWLIYLGWFGFGNYNPDKNSTLAFTFLSLFFAIFYATFLAYKFIRNKQFGVGDTAFLISNALIFYGVGYNILDTNTHGQNYLGLFTLLNAVLHFGVSTLIYKRDLADKNLFFLVSGLVLTFLTLAIPVQLDGHWITLFWACEMALVFWIGRTKQVRAYEILSYPIWLCTLVSLALDWEHFNQYEYGNNALKITPIFNIYFLMTVLVIASFGFIYFTNIKERFKTAFDDFADFRNTISNVLLGTICILVYMLFYNEIDTYLDQMWTDSYRQGQDYAVYNNSILNLKIIWLAYYTFAFVGLLSYFNLRKFNHKTVGYISGFLILMCISVFLFGILFLVHSLQSGFISQEYQRFAIAPYLRYLGFGLIAFLIWLFYQNIQRFLVDKEQHHPKFEIGLSLVSLYILSDELIHWLNKLPNYDSTKLGLSIFWGVIALALVLYGIFRQKRHLRMTAIGVFGFTLLKLFVYDLSHTSTIAKTIVMVSLGVLLLTISFFYNKYKDDIFEKDE